MRRPVAQWRQVLVPGQPTLPSKAGESSAPHAVIAKLRAAMPS